MTIDKLKEEYLSITLSLSIIVINYFTGFSLAIDMSTFMDKAISFSSISFGFLLTVLSLLLQTNNAALNRIKESGRFDNLINFNRKAVIASALLVFCALIYIGLKLDIKCNILIGNTISIRIIADTIALAIFMYQLIEVYLFLDLFYIIIKSKS